MPWDQMKAWHVLIYLSVLATYAWSSQVLLWGGEMSAGRVRKIYDDKGVLRHAEVVDGGAYEYVFESGVCLLGKLSFPVVAAVIGTAVFFPRSSARVWYLFWVLMAAWAITMAAMNPPFAIRSIPPVLMSSVLLVDALKRY